MSSGKKIILKFLVQVTLNLTTKHGNFHITCGYPQVYAQNVPMNPKNKDCGLRVFYRFRTNKNKQYDNKPN